MSNLYYTSNKMAADLIALLNLDPGVSVLDAGSGDKVWFDNLPLGCQRFECELERGGDFFEWTDPVDWVVGNPPFRDGPDGKNLFPAWLEQCAKISQKGFALLINDKCFSAITPLRLDKLVKAGFSLAHMRVVSDHRWRGRYFFLVWLKAPFHPTFPFVSYEVKSY